MKTNVVAVGAILNPLDIIIISNLWYVSIDVAND